MAVQKTLTPRLRSTRLGPWPGGIDEKADVLPPGKCAAAQNLLLDEVPGRAVKRNGSRQFSTLPSGLPVRDYYVFNKSDGTSYLLASDGAALYYTTDPSVQSGWTLLVSGLSSDAFMEFETAEDRVWMTNGSDAVMSWDGSTLYYHDRSYTATTDSDSVSSTTIKHAGLTGADNYWVGQKLSFTAGANQGSVVTITTYDSATQTLTFSPSMTGMVITDRWVVGVVIPKFRWLRLWDGHLWGFSTTDNPSEGRFHRLTDPNTGADITIDNPHAWPSDFQLAFAQEDGDRVWGASPILRDRIMVMKATGLFRIERDPLTTYGYEAVTKAIGSRFPRSWAEKDGLLYFMGQTRDGLPDVFITDMVSVRPVDKEGGLEPTLRQLRQPNAVQRSRGFSVAADWNTGAVGDGMDTETGDLSPKKASSRARITALLQARSNTGYGTTPGAIDLLGIPAWEARYEADLLPSLSSPAWSSTQTYNASENVASSILTASRSTLTGGLHLYGYYQRARQGVLSSLRDTYAHFRMKTDGSAFVFGVCNGSKAIVFSCGNPFGTSTNGLQRAGSGGSLTAVNAGLDATAYHDFNVLLTSSGTYKLWVDGVLSDSGTAIDSALNKVFFGAGRFVSDPYTVDACMEWTAYESSSPATVTVPGTSIYVDRAYYATDLQDASLIPSTLPTSGTLVLQYDHKNAPAAFLRSVGSLTLNGGTATLESWSSDTSDFSSGNDPAGYVTFSNGDVPTSLAKRYQRIRITLTRYDLGNSPTLTDFMTTALWRSPAISFGSNIAALRSFLDTLTAPAGTDAAIRIRVASTESEPGDSEYSAWFSITNGDNIGTIVSDTASPPTSRWAQFEVALGPSSAAAVPVLESASVEWSDGSNTALPLGGIVHKKRWMACAANTGSQYNDVVVVVDRNNAWMKYVGWGLNGMVHFRGNLVGFNSADSAVLQLDYPHYKDVDAAIDAYLVTRKENGGDDSVRKDIRYSDLHPGPTDFDLTASYKRPSDSDFTGEKTVACEGRGIAKRTNFPAATVTRQFVRKYRNAVIDESFDLEGETIYYTARAS